PSHDMVIGIHYLTKSKVGELGEGSVFSDRAEVTTAWQNKKVDLHAKVKVRGINQIVELEGEGKKAEPVSVDKWKDWTTVGRVLFNEVVPAELGYINKPQGKKELSQLVEQCYKKLGHFRTVVLLDELKRLGYRFATQAGITISISDMHIPAIKKEIIAQARKKVKEIEAQGKAGVITESERYNKIIDIWTHVTDKISDVMFDDMKKE